MINGKLILDDVSFCYEDHFCPVFSNVSLDIDASWKLGLIGRNGRGKSTLLGLLRGNLSPSSGRVRVGVSTELFPYDLTDAFSVVIDYIKENVSGLKSIENRLSYLEENNLTEGGEYAELISRYYEFGGDNISFNAEREFNYMGLDPALLARDYDTLSGGEKTKVQIIILYLRNPDFVLLDEPTNHLDGRGRRELAAYLSKKQGFIVVSHDADFLDATTDHIISINKSDITVEKGNFSSWKANKDDYEEYEARQKRNLERRVKQLETMAEKSRRWSEMSNVKHYSFRSNSRNRSLGIMKRASNAEKVINEEIEQTSNMLLNYESIPDLRLEQEPCPDNTLIRAEGLGYGFSDALLFDNLFFEVTNGDRICVSGQNGTGKSTLLNVIAGLLAPSRGNLTVSPNVKMSYGKQTPAFVTGRIVERLSDKSAVGRFMGIAKMFDITADILERPLESLSDGELKKVDIARVFAETNNLLLLDEPLNYTDIYFKKQLERAILTFKPTIIFVEHDGRFCDSVATGFIGL